MTPKINQNIKRFFWDVDFSKLDFTKDRKFVIERILELGDEESTNWLFSFYSQETLKDLLKKSTKINPKSANYWSVILNIPREEILCLKKHSPRQPDAIWKY